MLCNRHHSISSDMKSQILSIILCVQHSLTTLFGSGYPVEFSTQEDIIVTGKLAFTSQITYQLVLCTTKMAICFTYLRVFQLRSERMFVICLTVFISLYTTGMILFTIFGCTPISNSWTLMTDDCPGFNVRPILICGLSVAADLMLMIFVLSRLSEWCQSNYPSA